MKESLRIANNKSNPNRRQKELVPRRPRGNSDKNPSGSKTAVPEKQRGIPESNPYLSFTPKYDQSGRQKEINSSVPVETFCSDSDLRRNPTVHKKFLQALRNLFPFGAHYDRT